jgi:hypothetical protein
MRYLLITYVKKPNGQIDEQVEISRNVKPKDIQTCNVILDFKDLKVDKCIIEGKSISSDWEQLVGYYKQVYPAIIERLEKEVSQG